MLDEQEKNKYWALVQRCLTEFHRYSARSAARTIQYFRTSLEQDVADSEAAELIYHDEPFSLACQLSGSALDIQSHLVRYQALMHEIEAQRETPQVVVTDDYSEADRNRLLQQIFASYYQSEVRICDVRQSKTLDRQLYDRVLSTVVRVGADPLTHAPYFWAPSSVEAAIFLVDQQCQTGFMNRALLADVEAFAGDGELAGLGLDLGLARPPASRMCRVSVPSVGIASPSFSKEAERTTWPVGHAARSTRRTARSMHRRSCRRT